MDIRDFTAELLAFGEPTHQEPAFALLRNDLFAQLAEQGFRSIALETDRVAALVVDDHVRTGTGTLDTAMDEGFSHTFGTLDANRRLVAWMREYNEHAAEPLAFHGFDAAMEMMTVPSPRTYLEHARDYLGLDLDIAGLAGDDERWSRQEAVLDPAASPGGTAEADRLRVLADDLLTELYAQAPALIAATSRARWLRAKTTLTAGLGLLRYHAQCARPGDRDERISRLSSTRDALMARNLLEIRELEAPRGPTLVFAHNSHLQRRLSTWDSPYAKLEWVSAGAVVASLLGDRYAFVAGSLGHSEVLGLGEPAGDTCEGVLQRGTETWSLTAASDVAPGRKRTDTRPEQGYFPLDENLLGGADAVLHIA
ncbi:erythromycin esterase family protein [Amycolatopsis stemonae]